MQNSNVIVIDDPTVIHAYIINFTIHVRQGNVWHRRSLKTRSASGHGDFKRVAKLMKIAEDLKDWILSDRKNWDAMIVELNQGVAPPTPIPSGFVDFGIATHPAISVE